MVATSSTSSSDAAPTRGPHRHAPLGVPWALLIALTIVVAFETFLHTRPPMSLIAYASDEGQYFAVRDTVAVQGVAEVALVGSSQMREGVSMPLLLAEVRKKAGRPVTVANYATRGARVDAMDAVVRYLNHQPTPPKLIVVGLSMRDLRATAVDWPRVAVFWTPADWWHAFRRHGWGLTEVLPTVVRNEVGRGLWSLRYREEIGLSIKRPFGRFGVDAAEEGNPILGQPTNSQVGSRGLRSLADSKMAIHRMIDRAHDSYLLDRPAKPPAALRTALRDLAADLAAGPSAGLMVQMPVANYLNDVLVRKGLTKAFTSAVAADAKAAAVDFVPADAQSFKPAIADFSDLQHLNAAGAAGYARWLSGPIAAHLSSSPSR